MNFLVAVLTTKDAKKLDRCLSTIPANKYDVKVICNTTSPKYYTKAYNVCTRHNIEMVITDSNGTPGKGKNSVLEYFGKHTQYDFLIMIDGDDYFFPDGVNQIVDILTKNQTIDVLGLTNGHVLTSDKKIYNIKHYERNFISPPTSIDLTYFSLFLEHFNNQFSTTDTSIANFHRIIAYSQVAASKCRYEEHLLGCEDMLYSLKLKKLDEEKELKFNLIDCTKTKIHCYDITDTINGCSGQFLYSNNFKDKSKYLAIRANLLKNSIRHKICYV